jgi:hypothetical protein
LPCNTTATAVNFSNISFPVLYLTERLTVRRIRSNLVLSKGISFFTRDSVSFCLHTSWICLYPGLHALLESACIVQFRTPVAPICDVFSFHNVWLSLQIACCCKPKSISVFPSHRFWRLREQFDLLSGPIA